MKPKLKAALAVSTFLGAALCAASAFAGGVSVGIDASKPVHLSRAASSVFIGNPAIADVYIQSDKLVFLSGRSFGTTNLIALDAHGKTILNVPVTVVDARGETVTLQRGPAGRISYACAGRCEPTPMPGDDPGYAKNLLEHFIDEIRRGGSGRNERAVGQRRHELNAIASVERNGKAGHLARPFAIGTTSAYAVPPQGEPQLA